jgi:hypothetical protein
MRHSGRPHVQLEACLECAYMSARLISKLGPTRRGRLRWTTQGAPLQAMPLQRVLGLALVLRCHRGLSWHRVTRASDPAPVMPQQAGQWRSQDRCREERQAHWKGLALRSVAPQSASLEWRLRGDEVPHPSSAPLSSCATRFPIETSARVLDRSARGDQQPRRVALCALMRG